MGVEIPDWLPVGWKVCVKVRRSGKKDKYYVNRSKGLKFNSKPEVLRYLENSRKDRKPKNRNQVEIEKTVAENLPPGWIKEIRVTKKGGKMRRDPNYIDPVSGRHFRSMREVFRYLESENSEKAKPEPDDEDHLQSSSAEAKGSIDKKPDKILTEHESGKSGTGFASDLEGAKMKNQNVSKDNYLEEREEDDFLATELSDKLQLEWFPDKTMEIRKSAEKKTNKSASGVQRLKSGSNKLRKLNGKERHKVGSRQSKRLANGKLQDNAIKDRSLKPASEGDAVKVNISIEKGECCKKKKPTRQNTRKNSNGKWTSDLPRRTSKRLAHVEIDSSLDLEVKTSKKSRLLAELEIHTTEKKLVKSNDPNEHPTKSKPANLTKNKKPVSLPIENLSTLEEHKSDGAHSKNDEKPKKPEKPEKQIFDSSLNELLMDPCIEFAIKTLTGAIPIEDVIKVKDSPISSFRDSTNKASGSSSILSCGDIWADPCFDFAVKTLTGDGPISNLPKFRLDNFCPSNYSVSQCDDAKKPYVMQQGAKDHILPHAINGSSKSFGLHKGVEGRNGNFV